MPSDHCKFSTETRHNQKYLSSNTGQGWQIQLSGDLIDMKSWLTFVQKVFCSSLTSCATCTYTAVWSLKLSTRLGKGKPSGCLTTKESFLFLHNSKIQLLKRENIALNFKDRSGNQTDLQMASLLEKLTTVTLVCHSSWQVYLAIAQPS